LDLILHNIIYILRTIIIRIHFQITKIYTFELLSIFLNIKKKNLLHNLQLKNYTSFVASKFVSSQDIPQVVQKNIKNFNI